MAGEQLENPFLKQRSGGEAVRFRRQATIDKVDELNRTVEISFSSDVDLERWPGYFEKLDHSADAIDFTRLNNGASCLFNHDWDELLGVIEKGWISKASDASPADKNGRCLVRWGESNRAKELWPDVVSRVLRNVSVGYEVLAEVLSINDETGYHYTVTRWAPYEVSFVTVPADISVGVDRSISTEKTRTLMSTATETVVKETAAPATRESVTASPEKNSVNPADNAKRIIAIGVNFDAREEAAQAVADGITVQEFQDRLLERQKKAKALRTETDLGLSDWEVQQFSFARLAACQVAEQMKLGTASVAREAAKFELEVVEAAGKAREKAGHAAPRGAYIPRQILMQGRVKLTDEQKRAIEAKQRAVVSTSTGDSNVGATFQPILDVASFADLLRPESLLMNLATVVDGLEGTSAFELPKQVAGSMGGWVAEDGTVPGQDAIFAMLSATPHTAGGLIEVTRKSLLTSALPLESILRTQLAAGLGQTIDLAGYYGTGANGQPRGLTLTDGIKVKQFAGANPTWLEILDMETIISDSNVRISPDNSAYLTNSAGRGYAKGTQKFPATPTGMTIWETGNTVNGYRTGITNQISAGHWFLANWKELYACFWSGLDLMVDPFTRADKGRVRLIAMQDMDYLFRRPEAFTFGYHY